MSYFERFAKPAMNLVGARRQFLTSRIDELDAEIAMFDAKIRTLQAQRLTVTLARLSAGAELSDVKIAEDRLAETLNQ